MFRAEVHIASLRCCSSLAMSVYAAGQSLAVTFTKANIALEDTEVRPAAVESVTLAIVTLIERCSNSATMCVRINMQTWASSGVRPRSEGYVFPQAVRSAMCLAPAPLRLPSRL